MSTVQIVVCVKQFSCQHTCQYWAEEFILEGVRSRDVLLYDVYLY